MRIIIGSSLSLSTTSGWRIEFFVGEAGDDRQGRQTGRPDGAHIRDAFVDIPALLPEELHRAGERPQDGHHDVGCREHDADRTHAVAVEKIIEQRHDAEEHEPAIDGAGDRIGDQCHAGALMIGRHHVRV